MTFGIQRACGLAFRCGGIAVLLLMTVIGLGAEPKVQPVSPRQAVPVKVIAINGGWQLLRDGQPYFVKGAGGSGPKQKLAAAGANSLRTWGTDNLEPQLDECHRLGLTVAVGIWLGHERHGFNYNDADKVAEQYEQARETITRFKDHPAVLLWGIGNEMEGYEQGDNAAI